MTASLAGHYFSQTLKRKMVTEGSANLRKCSKRWSRCVVWDMTAITFTYCNVCCKKMCSVQRNNHQNVLNMSCFMQWKYSCHFNKSLTFTDYRKSWNKHPTSPRHSNILRHVVRWGSGYRSRPYKSKLNINMNEEKTREEK